MLQPEEKADQGITSVVKAATSLGYLPVLTYKEQDTFEHPESLIASDYLVQDVRVLIKGQEILLIMSGNNKQLEQIIKFKSREASKRDSAFCKYEVTEEGPLKITSNHENAITILYDVLGFISNNAVTQINQTIGHRRGAEK